MINLAEYFPSLLEVWKEQERQLEKWGKQTHPNYTEYGLLPPSSSVLVPPTADNAKRTCDTKSKNNKLSWNDIFVEEVLEACEEARRGDVKALREELVQVAAVCCSWIDCIDDINKASYKNSEFIGQTKENK